MNTISVVENIDNMEFMAKFADKYFDLAIIDPPYGIKQGGEKNKTRCNLAKAKLYHSFNDNKPENYLYFNELFRISKNQIIWGANHFISRINLDSSCWIVWDKKNGSNDFADCELAWTSFNFAVRKFDYMWNGMFQEFMSNKEIRIHPTQKPVALYKWLLKNYAKAGDKILDTHMGSQSSRIASYEMGYDYWGCEIDVDYYTEGCNRFELVTSQLKIKF